jgi:glycerophosphoryl diester phosphodiesterase
MKRFLCVLFSFILALGCVLPAAAAETVYLYPAYGVPENALHVIGHRGYSAMAPENTLAAFRLAGEYGFWGVECDTICSADGVWMVSHDNDVSRLTDGTGRITELTYEELQRFTFDAGEGIAGHPGQKIPMLTQVMDLCAEYGMRLVIEIKESAPEQMASLAELITARAEKENFILVSFQKEPLAEIKRLLPEIPAFLVSVPVTAEAIAFCKENGLDGIDLCAMLASSADFIRVRRAGLKTMAWMVDSRADAARLYRLGVTEITSNSLVPQPDPSPASASRTADGIKNTLAQFWRQLVETVGTVLTMLGVNVYS